MVRREEAGDLSLGSLASRCPSPAGASPASVSAGAPSSRPQASGEIPVARAGCRKPLRREPARGPQHQVKPAASTEEQCGSRAEHVAAKAMLAVRKSEAVPAASPAGVWGAARAQGSVWNRRDPSARPASGQGGSYKPMVKSSRAQRESEGVVVPWITVQNNAVGGKGPYSGRVDGAATCKGMTGMTGSNYPIGLRPNVNVRYPQHQLGSQPSNEPNAPPCWCSSLRGDALEMPHRAGRISLVRIMLRSESTTGKPCAGNPQARFDEGGLAK